MNDYQIPVPTDAELEILQVLWSKPRETVRFVSDTINNRRPPELQSGYTTTLKQMQVMLDKGLLTREIDGRNHFYTAALPRETTQNLVVRDLANLAFEGSAASLAMRALGGGKTTPEELQKIKDLILEIEQQQKF